MPAKKRDDDKKPVEPTNPATAAHSRDAEMSPAVEAKRSGPPPAARTMPKPLAPDAPEPDVPAPVSEAEGAANVDRIAEIDAKLKDPSFDHEGSERLKLAEESRSLPGAPYPPTTDVDTHGDPQDAEPKR